MDTFYPITLKLNGKKVVIVGGGKVAERKIAGLLGTEAMITVISPEITETIQQLSDAGKVHWLQKSFSKEDIEEAFLIFAATDDWNLNKEVKECATDVQLVTISNNPVESDFHVPSKVQRGRLNIAVSTGGASPILARKICRQLEQEFDERYEDFLEFLFQARQRILQDIADPVMKTRLLKEIAGSLFLRSETRELDFLQLYEEAQRKDK